ncbi:type II toxin-antitoxin system HipA family toxin [Ruania alkalisoli]|uniref:Type II toxin-antitoxin system HipA family toxin n=1 Tax=Ruania alkalisoli TaxID=2779775 RepID=A0A7M1SRI4_9MICO|nr:type II toxin-antitoxin system HipA family toxin [Ruania alkalisoli]QOR69747.1 type II toxin-antitoxin system HipA family toxin [Ruania alkalisoli]
MTGQRLAVILYGQHVADLDQTAGGQHVLRYRDTSETTPLSLTMPPGGGPFKHQVVEPVLEGLLPEREGVRESIAREFGVSARNPFALLSHIGLDCAGAVQFCPEDKIPDVLGRHAELLPLSTRDISNRIAALRSDPGATWLAPSEHWSLAGAQSKFAIRREGNRWFSATGAAPTTHIVKPGVDGIRLQALNEHISLQVARRVGLSAARSQWMHFDDEAALVVERYDRRRDAEGGLVRLHQEDLCQATSTYPTDKYESDGGPCAVRIVDLLRRYSRRGDRQRNVDSFVEALAFNVLLQAPDAHAKNYSVLLVADTVRLAPLYDVASGAPYDTGEDSGLRDSAMAIGGRRRFAQIDLGRWERFAREAALEQERVVERVRDLAARIPDAMSEVFAAEERAGTSGVDELRKRMLDPIARRCAVVAGG